MVEPTLAGLPGLVEAAALAPIGGRRPGGPTPSLMHRVRSRIGYLAAQLFTPRQKQFNLAVSDAVEALAREVAALRRAADARPAAPPAQEVIRARDELDAKYAASLAAVQSELAGLRAEVARMRLEVEPVHLRPGTADQSIWDAVVANNEYHLPDRFDPRDVVIDVGCHVGSFAAACLRRGAGKVFAFEVAPDNYALATNNLSRFGARAEVLYAACWRSDVPPTTIYFNPASEENTGAGNVLTATGLPVPTVPLDKFLTELPDRCGAERVRLLKLDCEGSEYPILLTSRRLDLVDEICGEFHEPGWEPAEAARVPGVERFTRHVLREHLERNGFTVEMTEYNYFLGAFFARRVR
jgi:FkbM family methyltransferase